MGKPGEEVEAKRIVLTAVCETCDQVFGATVIWFGETHGTPWLQAVHLRSDPAQAAPPRRDRYRRTARTRVRRAPVSLSRRRFLQGSAVGAVALGLGWRPSLPAIERDDTARLQAMLDRGVRIPKGTYRVTDTLWISHSYTQIAGPMTFLVKHSEPLFAARRPVHDVWVSDVAWKRPA